MIGVTQNTDKILTTALEDRNLCMQLKFISIKTKIILTHIQNSEPIVENQI